MDKKLSSCEEKDVDADDFWDEPDKIMQKAEKNLDRIDKGEKIAKAGEVAGALGISQNLAKNIKVTYTVFKYKGMTVISLQPRGNKYQTRRKLNNCYYLLVRKDGNKEKLIMKKIKGIIPKIS